MADAGAGVDVVVAEGRAHQLLHQIGFFVGAARGGDAPHRVAPVLGLNAAELAGGVVQGRLPAHLLPGLVDAGADHRRGDAVGVGGVAPGEAAFHAGMAHVRLAVLVRHHAHHFIALDLGLERTAHAAIGAGGGDALFRLAQFDDALFHQGRGRAGLHAGAAGHAVRVEEGLLDAGGDARIETTTRDRQREGALDFIAGAHAAAAHDALGGIEAEVGVGDVGRDRAVRIEMVAPLHAVAHFAQADHAGHVLQLTVAIGGAGQAVERVVGDVELHHAAAHFGKLGAVGAHHHAGFHRRGARGRHAAPAFDLDQAQAA